MEDYSALSDDLFDDSVLSENYKKKTGKKDIEGKNLKIFLEFVVGFLPETNLEGVQF